MILPVIPKMLDFQVSGLIGQGVGRYGTSQLARRHLLTDRARSSR